MGTRNLTCVVVDGEYKVAQYGQFDGYPTGQGQTIVDFLLDGFDLEAFKSQLKKCRFLDREGKDKEFIEAYGKAAPEWSSDPDNRTPEQKRWFHSYISRNVAGEILKAIATSTDDEIVLDDSRSFAADSLFCEWAYVLDLDKEQLEVYQGFNTEPLPEGERFGDLKNDDEDGKYYPVRLFATLPFKEITAESMSELEKKDNEDSEDDE